MKRSKAIPWKLIVASMVLVIIPLPAGQLEKIVDPEQLLLEYGMVGDDASRLLSFFEESKLSEIELAMLTSRLREGLVKRASLEQLSKALENRRTALSEAEKIMKSTSRPSRRGQRGEELEQNLFKTLVVALESGVPSSIFMDFFGHEPISQPQRIQAIIEAAERLHLVQVDQTWIKQFMDDCRDRGLRRGETIRATRFWITRHREGLSSDQIRKQLWGNLETTRPPIQKPEGEGQRNQNLRQKLHP